jgi:hypothetical protein
MYRNLKFPTVEKIRFNFSAIGPVVFAPRNQTCATELKKWTIGDCFHALKFIEHENENELFSFQQLSEYRCTKAWVR